MHDAELVHAELVSIAVQRDRLLTRQARLLVLAEELEVWRHFSCAHIYEYLERYCDLQPRTAREHIQVARALAALPLMRAKLEAEQVRYSVVRELTRIATPETEAEWLEHIEGMTAREVEDEVAGRSRGDRPHDPKDPDHLVKLTLDVRESTYAIFVDARMRYVDDQGERLSDDDLVLAMCRNESPARDGGSPPYQLSISTCRSCAKSFQITAGRELEVPPSTLALARCDALLLGDLESDAPRRATASVTPRIRRQVLARDRHACVVPGCRSKRCLDVHHIDFQSDGGDHKPSNLAALCSGHHRQLHEGRLVIRGRAPHGLRFTWPMDPTRTSTRSNAWSGGVAQQVVEAPAVIRKDAPPPAEVNGENNGPWAARHEEA